MSKKILVRIILPSKTFLEKEVDLVNVPGVEGVFGILQGHVKMISSLKQGIASLFTNGVESRYYVHGGVVQVDADEINIITEFTASIEKSNKTTVKNDIIDLEEELSKQKADSVEAAIINDRITKRKTLVKFL